MPKRQTIPHFSGLSSFMEELVLPLLQANPDYERLDGHSNQGNRTNFATFDHQGLKWKIAMDT